MPSRCLEQEAWETFANLESATGKHHQCSIMWNLREEVHKHNSPSLSKEGISIDWASQAIFSILLALEEVYHLRLLSFNIDRDGYYSDR